MEASISINSIIDRNFSYSSRMLENFKEQSKFLSPAYAGEVMNVYDEAMKELDLLKQSYKKQVISLNLPDYKQSEIPNLDPKNIKVILKIFNEAKKNSAKLIRTSHIQSAAIAASHAQGLKGDENVQDRVTTLAHGGFWGWLVKVFSPRTTILFQQAKADLEKAKNSYMAAHIQAIQQSSGVLTLPQIDIDKIASLSKENLKKRNGVISFNGTFITDFKFSEHKIQNQITSLSIHARSEKEKGVVQETFPLVNEKHEKIGIASTIIPLNNKYDEYLNNDAHVFEEIFGNKVIPSCNRQENHLIDAYLQIFEWGDKQLRFFRTGSLAKKFEEDKTAREESSKKMAYELLQAALLQQIKESGISLDQASQGEILTVNLASVSLLTPDLPRKFLGRKKSKTANERNQLRDQAKALQSFHNTDHHFFINGRSIPVHFNVMTFNFGVNEGATGDLKFAPGLKLGLDYQHSYNKEALKILEVTVNRFLFDHEDADDTVRNVWNEIQFLCRNPKSYLQSSNQYEAGAKIIYLMNLMGDQGAINCMSGKDRTGIMAAMIFTTTWVHSIQNSLKAELKRNGIKAKKYARARLRGLKSEFSQVFYKTLMSYGGLKITSLNTGGYKGYKVNVLDKLLSSKQIQTVQGLSSLSKD